MSTTKLTLSVEPEIVREAKRSAAEQNTSLSALFARLLRAMSKHHSADLDTSPITRRATGLVKLPNEVEDAELLTRGLVAKHRLDK